jgi:hypothetical protein
MFSSVAKADGTLYSVSISRKEQNVYFFSSGNVRGVIVTKYCYEYATNEPAVLRYEQYSYDNKLIFDNGNVCDVKSISTF